VQWRSGEHDVRALARVRERVRLEGDIESHVHRANRRQQWHVYRDVHGDVCRRYTHRDRYVDCEIGSSTAPTFTVGLPGVR